MLTAPGAVAASRLETETAWAVMVNAGSSITDEEEDLLPEGASEKIYVQVRHWAGACEQSGVTPPSLAAFWGMQPISRLFATCPLVLVSMYGL